MLQILFRRLRSSRQPLLQNQPDVDVELFDNNSRTLEMADPLLQAPSPGRGIRAELLRARWRDRVLGAALALVVIALLGVVVMGASDFFFTSPTQRGWVLLGLMYYIGSMWKDAWQRLVVVMQRNFYVRVVVSRMDSLLLFEAITQRLASLADAQASEFSTRDTEAFTEYDTATGVRAVKFNFWGTRPRRFSFRLQPAAGTQLPVGRNPVVTVDYVLEEDVICGRDSHVEHSRKLILWMWSSPGEVAQDKELLQSWCQECLGESLEPPPDRVEVYGLQESSSDWVPEWKLERTKARKSSSQAGDLFYLERSIFKELQADAQIWAKRSLRLYMVTGPPGVGKTEFTVWLAGTLRMPIYRLSLTMGSLTDARLAQLLSQNMMKHEAVVVQIDEFQEVLSRWDREGPGIAVTPGGFNEVLQGSTTLAKGVIVLTGTADVASAARRRAYPALFRRFQLQIQLGHLAMEDAARFFRSFLIEFVDNSDGEWQEWELQFRSCVVKHGPEHVSIDMIKQLLMRRITAACAAGYMESAAGVDKYRVKAACKQQVATLLMCGDSMQQFFKAYNLAAADSEEMIPTLTSSQTSSASSSEHLTFIEHVRRERAYVSKTTVS